MEQELLRYDDKIREIKSIDFDIFGNNEIRKKSVLNKDEIGITIPDLYDNSEPRINGLVDARLGTTNHGIDCVTCGLDTTNCPGHFGHIKLAEPLFHVGFLPFVKKILGCICIKCSKVLVSKNEKEIKALTERLTGKNRMNELREIVKNVSNCQTCGSPVAKIMFDKKKSSYTINLYAEFVIQEEGEAKKKMRQLLTANLCRDILSNISDADCELMGMSPKLSRPEMMIYEYFPVPPIHIRPSVRADPTSSIPMDDDLTHKLADIVKHNNKLLSNKELANKNTEKYSQEYINLLQYHVATYYDNETLSLPKSEHKGKSTVALSTRLKGKQGRLRNSLEGKRGDFSGRTVITPDPYLEIDELGIPIEIAMNLTKPISVTPQNIGEMQVYVDNRRHVYPGANFYYPCDPKNSNLLTKQIDLRFVQDRILLKVGDIVERQIIDGDYVLFNRQPTLHKQSMMAHRARVFKNPMFQTFRMNPAICSPYNAD
jgi:DNA-directed RNA polymerase II subunit RPB1